MLGEKGQKMLPTLCTSIRSLHRWGEIRGGDSWEGWIGSPHKEKGPEEEDCRGREKNWEKEWSCLRQWHVCLMQSGLVWTDFKSHGVERQDMSWKVNLESLRRTWMHQDRSSDFLSVDHEVYGRETCHIYCIKTTPTAVKRWCKLRPPWGDPLRAATKSERVKLKSCIRAVMEARYMNTRSIHRKNI